MGALKANANAMVHKKRIDIENRDGEYFICNYQSLYTYFCHFYILIIKLEDEV